MASAQPVPHAGRRSLTDDCVHCGFCLPACPTWNSWSEEMDSPRGRIDLMRGLAEGKLEWSDSVAKHFDRCLGCLACVPACPSGVRYDVLIEQTRALREESVPRRGLDRLFREALFAVLPYPDRLRILASLATVYRRIGLARLVRATGVLGRISPRLAALDELMPDGVKWTRPGGGPTLWLELPRTVDLDALEAYLARRGVHVSNASAAFLASGPSPSGPHLHGFRVAYAYLTTEAMRAALTIVADALRQSI